MVYIEKLQTKFEKPHLTLVDLLHKNNTDAANYLGIYPATHLLKPYVIKKLPKISVGAIYGFCGAPINDLLVEIKDIVVETTYQDLLALPTVKQIKLLTNYTIILSDLEEGGAFLGFMGPCLIEHIKNLGIVPKKIYSLNAGINQQDYPELNIESVYICSWAVFTMLNDQYFIDILFNDANKQQAIQKIKSKDKTFGLCLNKKPRYNRVKCLAELDQRNLLQYFDWTLLYSKHPLGTENDYGNFIKSPNNFRFNQQLESNGDDSMHKFLKTHSLPKLMSDSKQEIFGDSIGPSPSWVGKYKYYISNETYSNYISTSLGSVGFITEKTFKAMCIGAYPFIIGVPGSEKKLLDLGFKLKSYPHDQLEGRERIISVCETIESVIKSSPCVDEMVLHNFNLITDLDFLVGLIADPINQMFQPS